MQVPLLGKHSKAIIGGAFNSDNSFALLSQDKTFTVNNSDGDTIHQPMLQVSVVHPCPCPIRGGVLRCL